MSHNCCIVEQVEISSGNRVGIYLSAVQAEVYSRVDRKRIVACCRNKCAQAGGFLWRFIVDMSTNAGSSSGGGGTCAGQIAGHKRKR